MDDFTEALIARVRAARTGVEEAAASHDTYAVALAVDALEDALRLARQNDVDIPPAGTDHDSEQGRG